MVNETSKKPTVDLPTIKDMLEAGVHFGHETKRWNPSFREYIYTKRGNFHIIDLEKTIDKLTVALAFIEETAAKKQIILVGTKRQARDIVREEAIRSGAHFVMNRWVGGFLTNFDTIHQGIRKLRKIEEQLSGDVSKYSSQRLSILRREWARLDRLYGGVKFLDELPGAIIIIDALYERIPVREARVAGVPVIAVIDSNTDPKSVDYAIPGNDDAVKSVHLFTKVFADAIVAGNKGNGVKHVFADFSRVGIKEEEEERDAKDEQKTEERETERPKEKKKSAPKKKSLKAKTSKPAKKSVPKKATKKAASGRKTKISKK